MQLNCTVVGKESGKKKHKKRGLVKHCSKKQLATMPQVCAGHRKLKRIPKRK